MLIWCVSSLSADFRHGHGHDSLLPDRPEGRHHCLNAHMWPRPLTAGQQPISSAQNYPCILNCAFTVKEHANVFGFINFCLKKCTKIKRLLLSFTENNWISQNIRVLLWLYRKYVITISLWTFLPNHVKRKLYD